MAIYETKNYNDDGYYEVEETYPTIRKGGYYGNTTGAGAFYNSRNNGGSYSNHGFRITLRVTKNYYNDYYSEVNETFPTIRKGGYYGDTKSAGAFYNSRNNGGSSSYYGFRITLRVTKNYYDDTYSEVTETSPTILKGGLYSQTTAAGAFYNYSYIGVSSSYYGFRITLRVTN